jgi:hypothetical protein
MRAAPLAVLPIIAAITATVLLTGCGEPRTVGDVHVQGSVSTYDYYAEYREVRPNGKDKVYLLIDPRSVDAFAAGSHELPLSKTMIGAGPNKETLVIEQVKDNATSEIITKRVLATFRARAASMPAKTAPTTAPETVAPDAAK